MPSYRVLGYYLDNGQIYDGEADGNDVDEAVRDLRDSMYEVERENLMVIAVLDDAGDNLHGSDKAFPITEWETVP
jgi:hypothetical protein